MFALAQMKPFTVERKIVETITNLRAYPGFESLNNAGIGYSFLCKWSQ